MVSLLHTLSNICLGTVFVVWWEDAYLQDYREGKNVMPVFCDMLHCIREGFCYYLEIYVLVPACPDFDVQNIIVFSTVRYCYLVVALNFYILAVLTLDVVCHQ